MPLLSLPASFVGLLARVSTLTQVSIDARQKAGMIQVEAMS
jgi:hypothetical protein